MIDPITMTMLGVQAWVSLNNHKKDRELAERIKNEQRQAKREELLNNQRRDLERFKRLCQLQEQLERECHEDKIKSITQGFLSALKKMFNKESLDSNYILKVSPYVLQRSIIPLTPEDVSKTREELFCVLTGSNDNDFNRDVLPYLDDALCNFISSYWNEKSNHTIIYYEDMWDCDKGPFSPEDLKNLKPFIPNATLAITPFFKPEKEGCTIALNLSMWGLGNEKIIEVEVPTNLFFDKIQKSYSLKDINQILSTTIVDAVCAIGQMTDLFYWATEYKPPLLPYLLAEDIIKVPEKTKDRVIESYSQLFNSVVIGNLSEDIAKSINEQFPTDIIAINQYNHPERSVAFLESLMKLSKSSHLSSSMVRESVISLYKAKTDMEEQNLNQMNAALIQNEDIEIILRLVQLASDCNDVRLVREITGIIKRKIISWN